MQLVVTALGLRVVRCFAESCLSSVERRAALRTTILGIEMSDINHITFFGRQIESIFPALDLLPESAILLWH